MKTNESTSLVVVMYTAKQVLVATCTFLESQSSHMHWISEVMIIFDRLLWLTARTQANLLVERVLATDASSANCHLLHRRGYGRQSWRIKPSVGNCRRPAGDRGRDNSDTWSANNKAAFSLTN